MKIDINNQTIVETYDVGQGPQHMILENEIIWIARTFIVQTGKLFMAPVV